MEAPTTIALRALLTEHGEFARNVRSEESTVHNSYNAQDNLYVQHGRQRLAKTVTCYTKGAGRPIVVGFAVTVLWVAMHWTP